MKYTKENPLYLNDPSELDSVKGGSFISFNCKSCGKLEVHKYWPYRKDLYSVFLCKPCKTFKFRTISEGSVYTKDNPINLDTPLKLDTLRGGSWFTFKCEICGKEETHEYWPYRKELYSKFLCKKHKTESTNMEIYGKPYNIGTPKTIEKSLNTQRENNGGVLWQQTDEGKLYLHEYNKSHPEIHKQSNKKYELKTGYETPFHDPSVRKKAKDVIVEKYGTNNVMKIPEIKEKAANNDRRNHGGLLYKQTEEGRKSTSDMTANHPYRNASYKYNDVYFHSSWELFYWIYCKDYNIHIERCETHFTFEFNGEDWHKYTPDFIVNNKFIEIKGDNLWKESPINDKYNYNLARLKCAINNGVEIINVSEMGYIKTYVDSKYGKNYIQQFKIDKEEKRDKDYTVVKTEELYNPNTDTCIVTTTFG